MTKDEADEELLWALHAVAQNQTYLCRRVAAAIADSLPVGAAPLQAPNSRGERGILQLVADEMVRLGCLELEDATR